MVGEYFLRKHFNGWNQIRHLLGKGILLLHANVQADDFPVDP